MNYETFKSFVLVVLVGISFLLSFILWSYKPNYDLLYDVDYINEVDVGGKEKTKQELIVPKQVIFFDGNKQQIFKKPLLRENFVNHIVSNGNIYNVNVDNSNKFDEEKAYIKWKYQTDLSVEILSKIFSFDEKANLPDWEFKSIYFTLNSDKHSIKMIIPSETTNEKLTATIDNSQTYNYMAEYLNLEQTDLQDVVTLTVNDEQIIIPKGEVKIPEKTVIASKIEPELFVNALFSDPSLVTPNIRENYYTDGQRGLRVTQDDLKMEYVNPIQGSYEPITDLELIDRSVTLINEQKGWTNNFHFYDTESFLNQISFRMTYDGYEMYDNYGLALMHQEWRNQELYKYTRPLIEVGNVLNSEDITLSSGHHVLETIQANPEKLKYNKIKDIQIGYFLNYVDDVRSITLEPHWLIIYENDWLKFDPNDYHDLSRRGEA